jgi:hypothetical protein
VISGKALPRKLSKTNIALTFFILILGLSLSGIVIVPSVYHPTYAVYATKLSDKPSSYFVLNNPDRYVLESMSNQHSSVFNSLDETQIDELTEYYGTNNIEYNGTYYQIAMLYGDNFPPFLLLPALLAGIVISILAIVIIWLRSKVFSRLPSMTLDLAVGFLDCV